MTLLAVALAVCASALAVPVPIRLPGTAQSGRAVAACAGADDRDLARAGAVVPAGCAPVRARDAARCRGPGRRSAGPQATAGAGCGPDRRPGAGRVRRDGLRPRGRPTTAGQPPSRGRGVARLRARSRSPGRWAPTCPASCASSRGDRVPVSCGRWQRPGRWPTTPAPGWRRRSARRRTPSEPTGARRDWSPRSWPRPGPPPGCWPCSRSACCCSASASAVTRSGSSPVRPPAWSAWPIGLGLSFAGLLWLERIADRVLGR